MSGSAAAVWVPDIGALVPLPSGARAFGVLFGRVLATYPELPGVGLKLEVRHGRRKAIVKVLAADVLEVMRERAAKKAADAQVRAEVVAGERPVPMTGPGSKAGRLREVRRRLTRVPLEGTDTATHCKCGREVRILEGGEKLCMLHGLRPV